MSSGEVTKDGNAVVEAKNRLSDVSMVLEEFWVDAYVTYLFKLMG